VSRVGLGFSSNPKFRVFLEKVGASLFSLFFWVWILTVALRSCVPWCPCAEYFCLRIWDVSRVGLGFRLTQNLGFS
jgi:hypothetical protein